MGDFQPYLPLYMAGVFLLMVGLGFLFTIRRLRRNPIRRRLDRAILAAIQDLGGGSYANAIHRQTCTLLKRPDVEFNRFQTRLRWLVKHGYLDQQMGDTPYSAVFRSGPKRTHYMLTGEALRYLDTHRKNENR